MVDTPVHIVTLAIDEKASTFFNELRQQYFPAEINFLAAHLTLFHYLPKPASELAEDIRHSLFNTSPFTVNVTDVVSIGKGVAYKLESIQLQVMHKQLQQVWKQMLKPQDLQKLWPHITVQNKVRPDVAKQTLTTLKESFQPFTFEATGLTVWEYLNGPWKLLETIPFGLYAG